MNTTTTTTSNAGENIVRVMIAAAQEPKVGSVDDWVHLCTTAADEAFAEVIGNPPIVETVPSALSRLWDEWRREEQDYDEEDALSENAPEELMAGEKLLQAARAAASEAFISNMPTLSSRPKIKAHIACTAVALGRGHIDVMRATKLLYAAQVALTANPKRRANRG